jgi:hypothetical protein
MRALQDRPAAREGLGLADTGSARQTSLQSEVRLGGRGFCCDVAKKSQGEVNEYANAS